MFKKTKNEPILYKAHLARMEEERLRQEREARARLEEQIPKETEKIAKVSYRGTAQISVTSLFHGCGATYLAELLASFFSAYKKGSTCLIETKGLVDELDHASMDVITYPCELSYVYKKHYDFIVRDFGVFDLIRKEDFDEWTRSDYKCIVSWPDEQSLSRLAEFVKNTERAEEFIYFFNMVPKDRLNEIQDIMADYQTIILPCTSLDKMDKGLLTDLYRTFGKG